MGAPKQLDSKKTGWPKDFANQFKDLADFKKWYDPKYKGEKAEEVWKKIGGN